MVMSTLNLKLHEATAERNNTSNSGPPWMMDKCGPPRSRPIEVLIAHKLIL